MSIVSAIGPISVDATLTQSQINSLNQISCPGLSIYTTDFDWIIALRAADVNGDGYVDSDDTQDLFDYYSRVVLAHLNPLEGNIIGTTQSVYHIIPIT